MKIAQVVCVMPPYKGGIGTMAQNHAQSLVAKGHTVDVYTPAYDGQERIEERDGFTIHWIKPMIKYGNAGFVPQLYKLLQGYDLIHLHYPFYGAAEVIWWLKKRKKDIKLVITYHMDSVGGMFLKPFFVFYRFCIMPFILKAADKIIVTSNDYAAHSYISKLFYRLPNTFVEIPPEVNTQHFYHRDDISNVNAKYNLSKNDKVILFVGGMDKAHYFKGIPFLLDIFEILVRTSFNSYKLVLVGNGELQPAYKAMVKKKGLEDRVIFAGGVPYDELPYMYSRAHITALPSIDSSEAFGIVLIESLACETPIIASNLPGVRTVPDQDVNGFTVPVGNEGEFAALIKEVVHNDDMRKAMGIKGREKVLKYYDTKVVADALESVYKKVIDTSQ